MVLYDVEDRVLRKALLRLPIRGDVLRRIGLCVDGSDQETGQQTRGKNKCDPMPPSPRSGQLPIQSDARAPYAQT